MSTAPEALSPLTLSPRCLIVLCLAIVLVCALDYLGLFAGVNNHFHDLAFRIRGAASVSDRIILVEVNAETLERYGRWPIPRRHYAALLDRLDQADVVGFDIIMSEPALDDELLAAAVRRHGRVVMPAHFGAQMSALYPVQAITGARVGHIHLEEGIDGVVRETHHQLAGRDLSLLSFSATIFEVASGSLFARDREPVTRHEAGSIVQTDTMRINYRGGPGAFRRIAVQDILDGKSAPAIFAGKIVLVGVTAAGLGTELLTPFSEQRRRMPGVEVQANIIDNLLSHDPIRTVSLPFQWAAAFILALICFILLTRVSEQHALAVVAGAALLVTAAVCILFAGSAVWLPPALFHAVIITVFVITYVFMFESSVHRLDKAYDAIVSRMRWHLGAPIGAGKRKGIIGMLTPGGIHEKIAVMGAAANQLLFEKELADRALFTETHGVLLFGPDLRCLFANDRALIFGAANDLNMLSADAFVKALQPAIVDEDRDEIVREILAGTWRLQAFTVELPLPQKQFFTVDITLLDAGTERYTLFVFSDITKLKELEILKTHIASTVSHEIKTPMTSIQGFSELLAHNLDGKMKEYAEVINRQARSLVRFLDTFLDITRIEQGRQPFMMTTVRLQDVIAEVLTDLSPLAAGKQIQLHAALPDGDCLVRLDRDVIRQCLLNLTENAIKYSPQESAITVRLEDAPEQATIQVIDQGYGIAQDDLGRIFEKFYRASAPGFESIRGAGLGLTFVKEAIEAQGGFLTVQSTLGAGSTFTIIFPKAANSLTDEASFEKPAGE